MKKRNLLIIFALFIFSFSISAKEAIGTYKIVVNGYDWGPAVDKVIVTLDNKINSIDSKSLSVIESKKWYTNNPTENFNRTISNAYLSDDKGNKTSLASNNFVIELDVRPNDGSPFLFDLQTYMNVWNSSYSMTISLLKDQSLTKTKDGITKLSINTKYTDKIMPEVSKFKMAQYTSDKITLDYAAYSPKKDSAKNPLVVWLHGAGEGGTDPTIALLGNKVTALISDETQKLLGNAYVLVPQVPTFWMDNGTGNYKDFDGTSKYDKVLINLIKSYVDSNPDIDKSKIIIGGCSNGGFMTVRTVALNPTYFSAAFPISEAYLDSLISDDMITALKGTPIWFTQAINDPVEIPPKIVLSPFKNALPTFSRLEKAGAKDIHFSLFSNVKDTSGLYKNEKGEAFEYNAHFSWIHVLNNKSTEGDLKLFEWAASKVNPNK